MMKKGDEVQVQEEVQVLRELQWDLHCEQQWPHLLFLLHRCSLVSLEGCRGVTHPNCFSTLTVDAAERCWFTIAPFSGAEATVGRPRTVPFAAARPLKPKAANSQKQPRAAQNIKVHI